MILILVEFDDIASHTNFMEYLELYRWFKKYYYKVCSAGATKGQKVELSSTRADSDLVGNNKVGCREST
jgi:hypothetical protein